MDYFVVDIETCPLNKDAYLSAADERLKHLNPLDSRIIAIGIKRSDSSEPVLLLNENEKELLDDFWVELASFRKGNPSNKIIGFNIKNFDIPFLVTRSFILGVKIVPFFLKDLVEIREKIGAYKQGPQRGKLKEFGALLDFPSDEIDGSKIPELYWNGELERLKSYLKNDVVITEKLFQRLVETNIIEIDRW